MTVLIHHPNGDALLGRLLCENFQKEKWHTFKAAVAFVKRSGMNHLGSDLKAFRKRGTVRIAAGIDLEGTSQEGLRALLEAMEGNAGVFLFHNPTKTQTPPTFHPKAYLFRNDTHAECFVGSGNLTAGGLFANYELFTQFSLDLSHEADFKLLESLETVIDSWCDDDGLALPLSEELIADLAKGGLVPTEAEANARNKARTPNESSTGVPPWKNPFTPKPVPKPPKVIGGAHVSSTSKGKGTTSPGTITNRPSFLITLQNTDVGTGQTTPGTSKRSPELFIPLIALRENPEFWGFDKLFVADLSWNKRRSDRDSDGRGKMDRLNVRMKLGSKVLKVNFFYNPRKKDLRLRNSDLRDAGAIGDIIRIEKTDGNLDHDYSIRLIHPTDSDYESSLAACTHAVRNSPKLYRYL